MIKKQTQSEDRIWKRMVLSWVLTGVLIAGGGCSGKRVGMETFGRDLQSADPSVRIKAVIYAGNSGDRRTVPLLVDRLEDDDEAVRMATIESLKQLTGKDFGYRSFDPPYKRLVAVEQWRKWLGQRITASNPCPPTKPGCGEKK